MIIYDLNIIIYDRICSKIDKTLQKETHLCILSKKVFKVPTLLNHIHTFAEEQETDFIKGPDRV